MTVCYTGTCEVLDIRCHAQF